MYRDLKITFDDIEYETRIEDCEEETSPTDDYILKQDKNKKEEYGQQYRPVIGPRR